MGSTTKRLPSSSSSDQQKEPDTVRLALLTIAVCALLTSARSMMRRHRNTLMPLMINNVRSTQEEQVRIKQGEVPHPSDLIPEKQFVKATNRNEKLQQQVQQRYTQLRQAQQGSKFELAIDPSDSIYSGQAYDSSPIVLEEFKLIFFTVPKAGCTIWKQLFRRIKGIEDWQSQSLLTVHKPGRNGLKYLSDYSIEQANQIFTSPNWTRAIFVREPLERFLSAYLDKAVRDDGEFVKLVCCERQTHAKSVCERASKDVHSFLTLTQHCTNPHWDAQSSRLAPKHWRFVNFVGTTTHAAAQAKQLLQKIGAWSPYGESGWGLYGNESIFFESLHDDDGTNNNNKAKKKKYNDFYSSRRFARAVKHAYAHDVLLHTAAMGEDQNRWIEFLAAIDEKK